MSEQDIGSSVLEMEFEVDVRLATEEVRLGRLLDLKPGDVLQLSCNPEESVELVANDVPMASGELVVVDGKFGLRVRSTTSRGWVDLISGPDSSTDSEALEPETESATPEAAADTPVQEDTP
ncbi:MAG: FliM/FliN family flagellar motor switch protein [bacterium]|nr:FliM/FliN family flagellar motor switch protein [bacterium]